MTVAAADIAYYTEFTVSDGGNFTTTLFNQYKTIAGLMLDKLAPDDLDGTTYDYVHALLIAHLYSLKLGAIEVKSTTPEEWTFLQPGTTKYWLQAQAVLETMKLTPDEEELDEESDATRCDAYMPEMQLHQGTVPYYNADD